MNKDILVIGGGISGMTAAIEAAECGLTVHLVEKESYLGGRVSRMNKYFPKLCPPYCGMEINFRRLRINPRVKILTLSEVTNVSGGKGNYKVSVKTNPRYVNNKCVACDDCVKVCPESRSNDFNYGMNDTRAIYLPHQMAMPMKYVIDMGACKGSSCNECVVVCKYDAIDLAMPASETTIEVGAIIYATGWKPYDASRIENLGYGKIKNVVNNVEMERIAAPTGPTEGKILRRDNGQPVSRVAFVQCAGSRDENHLPYCSSICCLVSLKQATYVREQYPDSEVTIFYIDLRAPGKYEAFYKKVEGDPKVSLVKGKVAKIEENSDGSVLVTAEDILGGRKVHQEFDLVVLATGMAPSGAGSQPMAPLDENGFIALDPYNETGVVAAGVARQPFDVTSSIQDSTSAALKAIQAGVTR
ncbi:Anaerobic respiratory complex protein QmoA [hydrothermal vent metagenome]|uniref:Anaerobic respiratory complex protein QmoA n=1 Tax=hydrothermal vent metagenome TaxID=652676 RepID=A0A3B1BYC8_9ZZZZ